MRIAYLVSEYPATSHTFIRREVEELRRRGLDVQTFSIRAPQPGSCTTESDRAALETTFYVLKTGAFPILHAHGRAALRRPFAYARTLVKAFGHRPPGLRACLWALFYFTESIVLARELERRDVSRLHNHLANSGAIVGLLASSFLDMPWSMTLHGISETDYPAGLLLSDKIKHAQFVACASYFMQAQAMRVTPPSEWPKLAVVHCGLDFTSLPRTSAAPVRVRPRLICVGRLSPEKGHIGLLEAMAMMRADGCEADLVFVGDGPERLLLERKIAELGLQERVTLAGRLPEQDTLLQILAADVLVLPSFMEGLPVVLMEAMALGVPVVASRVAGIPELVQDENDGLLFCPADWSDLAQKLKRLVSDEKLRHALAHEARDKVQREFSIQLSGERLIGMFRRGFRPAFARPMQDENAAGSPGSGQTMTPGIVIIGRNEGERLIRCLESLKRSVMSAGPVVYVDSGSDDGSPEAVAQRGAVVVRLSTDRPFCAARARNAGFAKLIELAPELRLVQFLDGDCVLDPRWLDQAVSFLESRPDVVIACGRRREMHPTASIYNLMCDVEWNTALGEALSCGGDSMVRADAFADVAGFDPEIVAHEEPELCIRLRAQHGRVWRLPFDMCLHDAAILHFGQWWSRTRRSGFGYAQAAWKYRGSAAVATEVRTLASALFWSTAGPAALAAAWLVAPSFAFLLLIYPAQIVRIAYGKGIAKRLSWIYAAMILAAKFAEMRGTIDFIMTMRGRAQRQFDYKRSSAEKRTDPLQQAPATAVAGAPHESAHG